MNTIKTITTIKTQTQKDKWPKVKSSRIYFSFSFIQTIRIEINKTKHSYPMKLLHFHFIISLCSNKTNIIFILRFFSKHTFQYFQCPKLDFQIQRKKNMHQWASTQSGSLFPQSFNFIADDSHCFEH